MATKRWKTGLSMLAMTGVLLVCAMPAMGGAVAPRYDGVEDPGGALSALDGSFLTVPQGQSVVVKFETPVGASGDPSTFSLRIHMDGTSTGVLDTAIELGVGNEQGPTGFWGFLGDEPFIGLYTSTGSPDGLTDDWFQFSVYSGLFTFTDFQYVRIQAPAGASISIDAVEAPEFTTLPDDPVVMIENLIAFVADINGEQGISNSLDAKLDSALQALQDANTNNDASAVNKLQAFINEVEAQAGKKLITEPQAADLAAQAQAIIVTLTAP